MSDKQGQQPRGRADGAIRSAVDRCPVGRDPALAPKTKETSPRRTTAWRRPQSAGRHLVDAAQRGSWCDLSVEFPSPSNCWWRLRDRRPGCSSGRLPSLCIPGGGQARRPPPSSSSPHPAWFFRLRRPLFRSLGQNCRPLTIRSTSAAGVRATHSGTCVRFLTRPLVPPVVERTVRLTGKLPAADCALRPFADGLSRFLSYRMLHDHLTEGFEIASKIGRTP
jgi:hypothetical protein